MNDQDEMVAMLRAFLSDSGASSATVRREYGGASVTVTFRGGATWDLAAFVRMAECLTHSFLDGEKHTERAS